MTRKQDFGKVVDDRLNPTTDRGYFRWQGSPLFSGESGFIASALGILLLVGMVLGSLAAIVAAPGVCHG